MRLHKGYDLKKCLDAIPHSNAVVLSERGKPVRPGRYFESFEGDMLCIIGGFSSGDFKSDVYAKIPEVISICDRSLMVWTVTSEILVGYEEALLRSKAARETSAEMVPSRNRSKSF